jgi:NAD(P)H-dependent FMN reductase
MKKILAFAGSNSSKSINKELVTYTVGIIDKEEYQVEHVLLEDFSLPMFGTDLEEESGIPENAKKLRELFLGCDGFIFSSPEHNGLPPAFLKNHLDWISRVDKTSIFNDKPVFIMSTSPGPRGGSSNRDNLASILSYWGARDVESFGLPSFFNNFKENKITDEILRSEHEEVLIKYLKLL